MHTLRGLEIFEIMGEWFYVHTLQPTADMWEDLPCGHCGLHFTPEGHDGCLGTIPGVMNACCGHGNPKHAYIQLLNGTIL
jgi:hypothetical protein